MKKILIPMIAVVVLAAILFVPIPREAYDDGGTREYEALTYKIVRWNKLTVMEGEVDVYKKTRFYGFADKDKSIGELWMMEEARREAEDASYNDEPLLAKKPVIYLYPETPTDVFVKLDTDGALTCTYPAYNDGWQVAASPDGTLTDASGQTYSYLYWEGETYADYDFSQGFCIRGEDTAAFLEEALASLGLTRREANEFIIYWLPLMQNNPYNIITFQSEAYTDSARLTITPAPDTVIRIFMAWKASDSLEKIPDQPLTSPDRNGFTVVEWGGVCVKP